MTDSATESHTIEQFNPSTVPQPETMLMETPDVETAKSRDAALWNISVNDVRTEVVEDTKRFFGLLGKKLKVRATSAKPLMYLQARDFVSALMDQCELDLDVTLDDDCRINLDGEDSAIIIGRHGETLKAYEFLTNLMFRPDQEMPKIRFDCGGYKDRREESLIRLAKVTAKEAARRGVTIRLEPMSSWERRVIHMALQGSRSVKTSSEGEEPMRKIVVEPTGRADKRKRYRRQRY
jgi:spoIIIJ-associated protein